VAGVYEAALDRESAYERLTGTVAAIPEQQGAPVVPEEKKRGFFARLFGREDEPAPTAPTPAPLAPRPAPRRGGRQPDDFTTMVTKTAARSVTTAVAGTIGREIARGILGGLLGGGRKRR
jgi:hypothetical protein